MTKPRIILVGSGYHLYREYLLSMVAGAAEVRLFTTNPAGWESRYITGATVVDTLDATAMVAAARALPTEINGVVCWDEVRMPQAALLAEALGLPGGDPAAIRNCRDKHLTRQALDRAGVPQAISRLISNLEEAREAAAAIGYPVIVKPRALGASFGVSKAESPQQLDASYADARAAFEDGVPYYEQGVLVEEYLDGPEISVDSAIVDGQVQPLFIARKLLGYPPFCEEIGHSVNAADPLLSDPQLAQVLQSAHAAVGFSNGITHAELRLCAGGPRIIEVNCRLGGDMIPRVGWLASGVDPGQAAVQVSCGLPLSARPQHEKCAAIRFYYPEQPEAVVGAVEIDRAALPPAIVTAEALAQPGQTVSLPPHGHVTGRIAFAIAVDETAERCEAALDQAAAAIRLRLVEPVAQ